MIKASRNPARAPRQLTPLRYIAILAVVGTTLAQVRTAPRNMDYPFSGDNGSKRYSTLTQINAQKCQPAQRGLALRPWWTGADSKSARCHRWRHLRYGLTKTYALSAATGKVKWEYDPPLIQGRNPRGVGYWTDGKERRILITRNNFIVALDANRS